MRNAIGVTWGRGMIVAQTRSSLQIPEVLSLSHFQIRIVHFNLFVASADCLKSIWEAEAERTHFLFLVNDTVSMSREVAGFLPFLWTKFRVQWVIFYATAPAKTAQQLVLLVCEMRFDAFADVLIFKGGVCKIVFQLRVIARNQRRENHWDWQWSFWNTCVKDGNTGQTCVFCEKCSWRNITPAETRACDSALPQLAEGPHATFTLLAQKTSAVK